MSTLTKVENLSWLRETNPARLEELWRRADETRRANVGDAVHLRGLVEISNRCVRQCTYCGLRAGNRALARYRMSADEILECARQSVAYGYGTLVMQAGEDSSITAEWMEDVIRRIKTETPLAVTLGLGERSDEELKRWREAGADRYLLRFETSDRALFNEIHPPFGSRPCDRIAMLRRIKALGFETGSGVMVGIPGQTYESLATDIALFRELDLDMIGIGPFIPHPATPLGTAFVAQVSQPAVSPICNRRHVRLNDGHGSFERAAECNSAIRQIENLRYDEQVPATELTVYKAIALTRLVRPDANIPATTALATINKANGRELGLQRGANVFMPNLTPVKYRRLYEIYPAKACIDETGDACNGCLAARIAMIGRRVGVGPGGRRVREAQKELLCHA